MRPAARARIAPDFAAAAERYDQGETVVLSASRADDLLTPVAAYLKLGGQNENAFLLESVEGGAWRGR